VVVSLFLNRRLAERESRPYSDYGYPDPAERVVSTQRPEYRYIVNWVEPGSRVLDLGCGDGSLGELLIREKGCEVWGIEIDENGVKQALRKGVKAEVGNVDAGLGFPDRSFDYVVMNVTLQMVYRPDFVLREMLRVGRRAIVSFPNFAHIFARLELLFLGRFPQSTLYGYQWYNTRHIHPLSCKDFTTYIRKLGARVVRRQPLWVLDTSRPFFLSSLFPNLFSGTCIFMVEKP
jgi:methionine biosynthesis protein MetW